MKRLVVTICLLASVATSLSGCSKPDAAERGLLRAKLAERCMQNILAGPQATRYNDWDEVVSECSEQAYSQAKGCIDPRLCLNEMFPTAERKK